MTKTLKPGPPTWSLYRYTTSDDVILEPQLLPMAHELFTATSYNVTIANFVFLS